MQNNSKKNKEVHEHCGDVRNSWLADTTGSMPRSLSRPAACKYLGPAVRRLLRRSRKRWKRLIAARVSCWLPDPGFWPGGRPRFDEGQGFRTLGVTFWRPASGRSFGDSAAPSHLCQVTLPAQHGPARPPSGGPAPEPGRFVCGSEVHESIATGTLLSEPARARAQTLSPALSVSPSLLA